MSKTFVFISFEFKTLKRSHETSEMPTANKLSQIDEKSPSYMRKRNLALFWAIHGKHSGSVMLKTWREQQSDNDNDEEQKVRPPNILRSKLKVLHHLLRIKRRYQPALFHTEMPIASRFPQEGEFFPILAPNEILQKQRRAEGGTVMVRMM